MLYKLKTSRIQEKVYDMAAEMHDLWKKGYTPKVKTKKGCSACSLKEICVPKLSKAKPVETYIDYTLSGR